MEKNMDAKCKENQCKYKEKYSSTPATGEGLITQSL